MSPAPTALSSHCAGSTPGRGTANAVIAMDPTGSRFTRALRNPTVADIDDVTH